MTTAVSMNDVSTLLKRMEGLMVALVTPLTNDGTLDVAGLERLIERVLDGGATCLFALGWAGEGPLLGDDTRLAVIHETCRIARGRVPVMIGVSEQSLNRAMVLVEAARRAGANLVLSTPPYSYAVPEHLLAEYFANLAKSGGLPVVVYQNDELGKRLSFETLLRLSQTPGIIATKAFVPYNELQRYYYKLHEPGRFAVISGDEYQYAAALLLGIRHFTMGGPGNLCPTYCASMYAAACEARWDVVRAMHRRLVEFCHALYALGGTAYSATKGALFCLDICAANICSPHAPLTDEDQKAVRGVLADCADVFTKPGP